MNIVMILVNIINKNSTPEAPYLIIGSTDAIQNQPIEKMIWLSLLMIDLYLILWPTGFFLRFPHLFMGSTTLDTRRKSFYVNGNISQISNGRSSFASVSQSRRESRLTVNT